MSAVLDVTEHLTCPICIGLFYDPVELQPCGHLLCEVCAVQLVAHREDEITAKCPICRAESTGTGPCNRVVTNIVEVLQSLHDGTSSSSPTVNDLCRTPFDDESAPDEASVPQAERIAALTALLAAVRSEKTAADRRHRAALSTAAAVYRETLEQLREELKQEQTARAEETAAADRDLKQQDHKLALRIQALADKHRATLMQVRNELSREQAARAEEKTAVALATQKLRDELEVVEQKAQRALADATTEHESEMQTLTAKHDAALSEQHAVLERVQDQLAQEKASTADVRAAAKRAARAAQDNLHKLEATRRELEDAQRKLADTDAAENQSTVDVEATDAHGVTLERIQGELAQERAARTSDRTAAERAALKLRREVQSAQRTLTDTVAEHKRTLDTINEKHRAELAALSQAQAVAVSEMESRRMPTGAPDPALTPELKKLAKKLLSTLFDVKARLLLQDPETDLTIFAGTVLKTGPMYEINMPALRTRAVLQCKSWLRENTAATTTNAETALALATRLYPGDPTLLYLSASAAALSLHTDRALDRLSDAITAGYTDGNALAVDPNFVHLRGNSRFVALVTKLGGGRPVTARESNAARDARTPPCSTAASSVPVPPSHPQPPVSARVNTNNTSTLPLVAHPSSARPSRRPQPQLLFQLHPQVQSPEEVLRDAFPAVSEAHARRLLLLFNGDLQRAMCSLIEGA